MRTMLRRLLADETGQDLIEYALLAALIATVSAAALSLLGEKIPKVFMEVFETFPAS